MSAEDYNMTDEEYEEMCRLIRKAGLNDIGDALTEVRDRYADLMRKMQNEVCEP